MLPWIASAMTLMGVYLLGKKVIWGWLASWTGSVLWTIYSIQTEQYHLLGLNCVFIWLDTRGFLNWRKS